MLAAVICLSVLCVVLTLGMGVVVGYLFRQYVTDVTQFILIQNALMRMAINSPMKLSHFDLRVDNI